MDFPATTLAKPFISKLIALQSFFFSRPRLDLDLVNDPTNLFGQKSLGPSYKQNQPKRFVGSYKSFWSKIIRPIIQTKST